jgi:hypothetical protein
MKRTIVIADVAFDPADLQRESERELPSFLRRPNHPAAPVAGPLVPPSSHGGFPRLGHPTQPARVWSDLFDAVTLLALGAGLGAMLMWVALR